MATSHVFGLYFTEQPIATYVMDDFGNAILLKGEVFMRAIDFIITAAHGYCH